MMINKSKQLILIGILGLLAFCLIGFERSEKLDDRVFEREIKEFHSLLEDGNPFYTYEQANKIANELIPMIEKTTGRKFKKNPVIKLINSEEFKDVIIRETDIVVLNDSVTPMKNEKKFLQMMLKMFYGAYGSRDQIVYLLPKRIPSILKLLNIDEKYGMDIVRITIAHELTHALQDQYLNLFDRRSKLPGREEIHAFSAAIEGHAVLIEKKIGRQLGVDDVIINLFPLANSINIKFNNPKVIKMMTSGLPLKSIYSQGERFINYYYEKGGHKLIWEILENPPINTAMINDPKTYSPKPYDYLDYKSILEKLYNYNKHYENEKFIYENTSLSRLDLNIMFRNVNFPQKNLLISKVKHYQFFSVYSHNILMAQVTFILLEDSKYASQYTKLREKFILQKFQNAGHYIDKEPWKDIGLSEDCVDFIDFARQTSITLEVMASNMEKVKRKNIQTIIGRKNMIMIHNDGTFELSPCEIGKISSKIFNRYQKAMKETEKNKRSILTMK
ncbi:hypothetical protein [Desulfobacula sp.]|uniref:hypothetical protein n=1 Tax=Desulfobacula sp. TaxID=2593537 RepID=UPI00262F79D6|nr:hypothetical protein [Desulfobacula sp.]